MPPVERVESSKWYKRKLFTNLNKCILYFKQKTGAELLDSLGFVGVARALDKIGETRYPRTQFLENFVNLVTHLQSRWRLWGYERPRRLVHESSFSPFKLLIRPQPVYIICAMNNSELFRISGQTLIRIWIVDLAENAATMHRHSALVIKRSQIELY